MPKINNFKWFHTPYIKGTQSFCLVDIYYNEELNNKVVILTEPQDNSGKSVTNACCEIVTDLLMEADLELEAIWIEHYPAAYDKGNNLVYAESYDLILFTWRDGVASNPEWHRLTLEEVERMIGDNQEE